MEIRANVNKKNQQCYSMFKTLENRNRTLDCKEAIIIERNLHFNHVFIFKNQVRFTSNRREMANAIVD